MQSKGLQKHLANRDHLSFVSELKTNTTVHCPYGFKMNETIWTYFIDIMLEYLSVTLDEVKIKGTEKVVRTVYGVERIKDWVLLEEMRLYHDKLNVDRLVSFGAALALMRSYSKYGVGVTKVDSSGDTEKEKKGPVITKDRGFFKNIGSGLPVEYQVKRNFFKNYN